jgi:hypothetical protein
MPNTVDDFIKRFGGEQNPDEDQEVTRIQERFVSSAPEDQEFDTQSYHEGVTEYLGQLPDDQFQQAVQKSYSQLSPQERQGLLSTLTGALASQGLNIGSLAQHMGLSSDEPQKMSPEDYARLSNYARHEQPEAMKQVITKQPWWLKALGHPVLMGALGLVASKMLHGRLSNK